MRRSLSRLLIVLACALAPFLPIGILPIAHADFPGYVHVVREGETLASIAQRYYGDPRRETVLVAENGLEAEGGAAIVVGMRLAIPQVAYHRVLVGETWAMISDRYFGTVARAFAIQDANPSIETAQPTEGAELLIPYPLRHVASQRDTLNHVAQSYYGDIAAARTLRRFNGLRSTRLSRGQVILVPLADLILSEEGMRLVADSTGVSAGGGEIRALQERIALELPTLGEAIAAGQYTEAVAIGNRLLGSGELTGNQIVTIQRSLAVAYIALGRADLARLAFEGALRLQPDLELDTRRTSPSVLAAFAAAQAAAVAEAATASAAALAAASDSGMPPDAGVAVEP